MAVILHSSNSRLHLDQDVLQRSGSLQGLASLQRSGSLQGLSSLQRSGSLQRQALINLHTINNNKRRNKVQRFYRDAGDDALATNLSAIYGKLLVVLGIALPVTETIIPTNNVTTYDGFYLYLHMGSVVFLLYIYGIFLKSEATRKLQNTKNLRNNHESEGDSENKPLSDTQLRREVRYGSFYLRMGVGAFGIGSMIFAILNFARYWELKATQDCDDILIAVTPLVKAIFIVAQIVFIFSDANKFIAVNDHALVARFGIMHMIAANLSEWLFVVVQETKLDIVTHFKHQESQMKILSNDVNETEDSSSMESENETDNIPFFYSPLDKCLNTHIMNQLLRKASPFLFPCSVEYSLLCAVILAVMWNTACSSMANSVEEYGEKFEDMIKERQSGVNVIYVRSTSRFSVDCANANKGLFGGMIILVLTTVSLIMFFELVEQEQYKEIAVFEVNVLEAIVYVASAIASIACLFLMRNIGLRITPRNLQLEHVLLFVTQSGIFLYTLFQIIGAVSLMRSGGTGCVMRIITPMTALVQSIIQTMLVLDAWKRRCNTPEQLRSKPGRHLVTFLLISNMSIWISHKLKNNRAEFHPMQMKFYGPWAWAIITHVTMPLLSCYRFQSAVCLYEIWKHVYKMRQIYE